MVITASVTGVYAAESPAKSTKQVSDGQNEMLGRMKSEELQAAANDSATFISLGADEANWELDPPMTHVFCKTWENAKSIRKVHA